MERLPAVCDYNRAEYSKSNFLIGGKYKSSLLENKVLAIALANIQNVVEEHGLLYSRIKASELRKMLGANSGSFYNQLEPVARALTGKTIGMAEPDKKIFDYMAIIIHASYADGIFTIKFNPEIKDYIHDIKKNFTLLQLPIMLSFKSVYSFRLYELLKSKAYYPKQTYERTGVFHTTFLLSELKFDLGVVNAELDSVKRILANEKNPDFDKAIDKSPEKVLNNWGDFKKKVLEVAKKEINQKTDIVIDYTPVRGGKGGKIFQLEFTIRFNSVLQEPETGMTDADKLKVLENMSSYIPYPLSLHELETIAEAANYDLDKIKKAYDHMQEYEVTNVAGWLISALKNNYSFLNYQLDEPDHAMSEQEFDKLIGLEKKY